MFIKILKISKNNEIFIKSIFIIFYKYNNFQKKLKINSEKIKIIPEKILKKILQYFTKIILS